MTFDICLTEILHGSVYRSLWCKIHSFRGSYGKRSFILHLKRNYISLPASGLVKRPEMNMHLFAHNDDIFVPYFLFQPTEIDKIVIVIM